jgi:hypothetical protein
MLRYWCDEENVSLMTILFYFVQYTVKPVYNSLDYNEFPVITEHIVFTDSIHFFKN